MPLQKLQLYLVRFELPDGEHLASLRSVALTDENAAAFVTRDARTKLATNEDVKILDIEPIPDGDEGEKFIQENTRKLYEKYPDRVGAEQLGLDTPNRIITDPEIARGLASRLKGGGNVPGGAVLRPSRVVAPAGHAPSAPPAPPPPGTGE